MFLLNSSNDAKRKRGGKMLRENLVLCLPEFFIIISLNVYLKYAVQGGGAALGIVALRKRQERMFDY